MTTENTKQLSRRTVYLWTGLASAIVLVVLAIMVSDHALNGFELSVFRWLNDLPSNWHTVIEWMSEIGLFIGAFIAVCAVVFRRFKPAWNLIFSMGSAYVAAFILKRIVDRPRPEGMLEHLHVRMLESGAGFPSAHATIITAVMVTLFPYLPKKWRWIIVPGAIGLVAASRVYLGVHSPFDVLGGIALGLLVVCVIRLLPRALRTFLRLN